MHRHLLYFHIIFKSIVFFNHGTGNIFAISVADHSAVVVIFFVVGLSIVMFLVTVVIFELKKFHQNTRKG